MASAAFLKPIFLNWYRVYCILTLAALLLALMPIVSDTSASNSSSSHAQPALLELADRNPEAKVSVIVQKTSKDSDVESFVGKLGGTITRDLAIINGFTAEMAAYGARELAGMAGVRWVSLDAPVVHSDCSYCISTSNLKNNYNVDTGSTKVWNEGPSYFQGKSIGVAVVDSGITYSGDAEENGASRIVAAVNLNSGSTTVNDGYGHGTHVAGIIAGNGKTSYGSYIGIAPQANLINVKVSNEQGGGTASDVVNGLNWILKNKSAYNIRVVNISLNESTYASYNTDPIDAAAEILWFNGIVVVVSSGNNGALSLNPPANDPFVISVGATQDDTGLLDAGKELSTTFSAYGTTPEGVSKPDLVAPGYNIVSRFPSSSVTLATAHPANLISTSQDGGIFFRMSGTSMAAPIVSGAAALLLQSNPNLTPDQVKSRLKSTAVNNLPRWTGDTRLWTGFTPLKHGAGFVDVYAAVHSSSTASANTGIAASQLLWTGSTPVTWNSVNWNSVNWSSVNWSSVNWSSVNWSSVNWNSDYWGN